MNIPWCPEPSHGLYVNSSMLHVAVFKRNSFLFEINRDNSLREGITSLESCYISQKKLSTDMYEVPFKDFVTRSYSSVFGH